MDGVSLDVGRTTDKPISQEPAGLAVGVAHCLRCETLNFGVPVCLKYMPAIGSLERLECAGCLAATHRRSCSDMHVGWG